MTVFKVLERIFRDKIATEPVSLSGSQRFRGKLSGSVEESLLPKCQRACPVGAFQVEGSGYKIDYKKCIFCGKCVEACAMTALEEGNSSLNIFAVFSIAPTPNSRALVSLARLRASVTCSDFFILYRVACNSIPHFCYFASIVYICHP